MDTTIKESDRKVLSRDSCTCQYCGLSGLNNFDIWMNLLMDHIVPCDAGGDESAENTAVACWECNCLKGHYRPSGHTREERIADAKKYVQAKRDEWRKEFER